MALRASRHARSLGSVGHPSRWRTRRSKQLAIFASLVVLLGPRGLADTPLPAAPWEAIDLGGVPEIRSIAGVLSVTLDAAPATVHVGAASFPGMVYNGAYAGPLLHVRPGDQVRIRLLNHLAEMTNLHFHGLRISPLDRGDNMHIQVPPGAAQEYAFTIPRDHPPGLFWYHDHAHGNTETHVMAGLGGAILIDGFTRRFGGLQGVAQKLLVLKDYTRDGCDGAVLKTELHCRVISVNGTDHWDDRLRPGETQLWRLTNQGANLVLHLAAPGLSFRIIGRDGLGATMPTALADGDSLDVMPASRIDVLATAHGAASIDLIARNVPTNAGGQFATSRVLGHITVAGDAAPAAPPVRFARQTDLRGLPIDARRTIVFTENETAGLYYVDGKLFDHRRVDLRVPLGNIEEWTVQNKSQDFHEFHIHQLGFQVTEIDGVKQDFTGYVDDVKVPEMGEVKIILPFTDPLIVGDFMYHCHVLKHEDKGMMAIVEVYRTDRKIPLHLCLFPPSPAAGGP